MTKILIAFVSRTGSTAEVAAEIGKMFTAKGVEVDVVEMQNATNLPQYQAVILGSAIQNRQWLPEAVEFVQVNKSELATMPCAMYTLCMTLALKNGEKYRSDIMGWIAPVRRLVNPVSEGLFPGRLDIARIPSLGDRIKFRMSVIFGVWSEGDHRDWDAIRQWIAEMSQALVPIN